MSVTETAPQMVNAIDGHVRAFLQVQSSMRWFVDNYARIADWQAALRGLAQLALEQLQYLSGHMGGGGFYLAKGVAAMLAARDELIWREFNGRNYAELARAHGLTEMRVRQIVAEQRARDMAQRQGRLPGLDDQG